MRILSFYPTKTFKLIMEFEKEYRILDIRKSLQNDQGLLKDLCSDVNIFLSADLDETSGSICWENGVDFDPNVLYEKSLNLDKVIENFVDSE